MYRVRTHRITLAGMWRRIRRGRVSRDGIVEKGANSRRNILN
jgi:hypothetical protein